MVCYENGRVAYEDLFGFHLNKENIPPYPYSPCRNGFQHPKELAESIDTKFLAYCVPNKIDYDQVIQDVKDKKINYGNVDKTLRKMEEIRATMAKENENWNKTKDQLPEGRTPPPGLEPAPVPKLPPPTGDTKSPDDRKLIHILSGGMRYTNEENNSKESRKLGDGLKEQAARAENIVRKYLENRHPTTAIEEPEEEPATEKLTSEGALKEQVEEATLEEQKEEVFMEELLEEADPYVEDDDLQYHDLPEEKELHPNTGMDSDENDHRLPWEKIEGPIYPPPPGLDPLPGLEYLEHILDDKAFDSPNIKNPLEIAERNNADEGKEGFDDFPHHPHRPFCVSTNALASLPYDNRPVVFVGGLDPATTEAEMHHYFSQFGCVRKVLLKPGCFGFVTFYDQSSKMLALAQEDHTLCGRKVNVEDSYRNHELKNYRSLGKTSASHTISMDNGTTAETQIKSGCHIPNLVGHIKMYNPLYGWGFVNSPHFPGDIFLHYRHFLDEPPQTHVGHFKSTTVGRQVLFDLDLNHKDKPQCLNVRILGGNTELDTELGERTVPTHSSSESDLSTTINSCGTLDTKEDRTYDGNYVQNNFVPHSPYPWDSPRSLFDHGYSNPRGFNMHYPDQWNLMPTHSTVAWNDPIDELHLHHLDLPAQPSPFGSFMPPNVPSTLIDLAYMLEPDARTHIPFAY